MPLVTDGLAPSEVQLPVGVSERMRQCCGRCTEPNHYLLNPEAMRSVLDGVTLGATCKAEGYDPAVVEGDCDVEKEVCVAIGQVLVEVHMTNWAEAQRKIQC